MQLVIAERANVGAAIGALLGATERKDGYTQGGMRVSELDELDFGGDDSLMDMGAAEPEREDEKK